MTSKWKNEFISTWNNSLRKIRDATDNVRDSGARKVRKVWRDANDKEMIRKELRF